ncbi:AraC family transcriptional regulator [Petroclostridium sp. X23]|uniref:AraC family transcriptional regulator n=1 Tax=Petroclostridium sp. X23 TaxID=3045146 RepID=UPI0024AD23D6|nr:AraC family transcriptional regulator [Petroclostridium sp. X23]WHH61068.1 AraC family transcriptional regulator [Petroclostridium sp. X23]
MMDKYTHFMNQIPEKIKQEVEMHICSDIVLFKPQAFITGTTMHAVDFHIIIPTTPPPDTYINDRLRSFDHGKIVAINPGDTVLCTKEHATKQYLSLLIKPELVNKIAEEMGFSEGIRFLKLQNPYSRELMQAINNFDKETKRPDKFKLMQDCLGVQIVALLLRELKTNLRQYPANSPDGNTYIALAIEYIHAFFSSNISIEDICREINVSSFHFIRTFKKEIGISPHRYLLNLRIKKAEELIRMGQYSIAEVAMMCGFVSLSHFSSTFKGITGLSPREFRRQKHTLPNSVMMSKELQNSFNKYNIRR